MQGNKQVKNSRKKSIVKLLPSPCGCYICTGDDSRLIIRTRCRKKYFKYPAQDLQKEIELN